MYVVFDTNVFVRAAAEFEEEHAAWGALVRVCHSLAVSSPILEEYKRVIHRYGYNQWFIMLKGEELKAIGKLKEFDREIKQGVHISVKVPEKDVPFLQVAIAAHAPYLVTEDCKHFISKQREIKAEHNITVLKPKQYYDLCQSIMRRRESNTRIGSV